MQNRHIAGLIALALTALAGEDKYFDSPDRPSHQENYNKVVFFKGKAIAIHKGTSLWIFYDLLGKSAPMKIDHKECEAMLWDNILVEVKNAAFVCVARDLPNANRKLANFYSKGIF